MTREEFQKIVDEVTGGEYFPPERKNKNRGTENRKGYYGPTTKIEVEWMTGGAWGGNCWDDSDPSSYSPAPDPEKELKDLDAILEKICPDISFMQYKVLMQKIKYNTRSVSEYYGNHTSYASKEILIEDIWNFLEERGLV
jgi:hypothetical protein